MKLLRVFAVIALVLSVAACGDDTQVGSAINPEELDDAQNRLGEFLQEEETEAEGGGFIGRDDPDPAASDNGEAEAQQDQEERDRQIQEQREQAAIEMSITAGGYDPYFIRVFAGGTVRVVNRDGQARSVVADKGEFDSGPLQPGESWNYEATQVGKFNFHDGTRPYVVGTLEVLAR